MKNQFLLFMIMAFFSAQSVNGQNAIPDSLFGNNAILYANPGGGDDGSKLMLQPDGKIIYGGYDYDISQNDFHNNMVRFDECGLLDSSFGTNGIVHHKFDQRNIGYVYQLQDDGKILCGGMQASSNAGSQQFPFIARYNADGSVDTNFAIGGTNKTSFDGSSAGTIYSVAILPDGRIECTGTCNCGGGGVMRFMPDGSPDSTYSSDGKALHTFSNFSAFSEVYGHRLQNGKTILVGATWDGSFIDHFVSYCFDSTGVLDTTFGVSGFFNDTTQLDVYSYGVATAIQADEKVVMAANRPSANGIEVVRISSNGLIDGSFGNGGHVSFQIPLTQVKKMKIMSNGQIMIMGSYQGSIGAFGVLLNTNGTIDSTFGPNGYRIFDMNHGAGNGSLVDILELASGKWIAATTANGGLQVVKFADQSNVPHISQNFNLLQTTGTGTYQWFLNGNIIGGATGSTYMFTQNGVYTVLLTDASGCTYLSDPYTVTNSGIAENETAPFSIFPNPTSGNFTVSFHESVANGYIEIINTLGETVLKENILNESNKVVNLMNISGGIYFVQVYDGVNLHSRKIMIDHH